MVVTFTITIPCYIAVSYHSLVSINKFRYYCTTSKNGRDSIGKCLEICELDQIPARNYSCNNGVIEKCLDTEATMKIGDDKCINKCLLPGVPGLGE